MVSTTIFTTTTFLFPCVVFGATTSFSLQVVGFHLLHEVLERPVHFSFFILMSVGSVGWASLSFVGWAWMSFGSWWWGGATLSIMSFVAGWWWAGCRCVSLLSSSLMRVGSLIGPCFVRALSLVFGGSCSVLCGCPILRFGILFILWGVLCLLGGVSLLALLCLVGVFFWDFSVSWGVWGWGGGWGWGEGWVGGGVSAGASKLSFWFFSGSLVSVWASSLAFIVSPVLGAVVTGWAVWLSSVLCPGFASWSVVFSFLMSQVSGWWVFWVVVFWGWIWDV